MVSKSIWALGLVAGFAAVGGFGLTRAAGRNVRALKNEIEDKIDKRSNPGITDDGKEGPKSG